MTMTVRNAFALLGLFSINSPELGLSEIKRAACLDKATAHRLLTVLRETGMLEQNPSSRLYRLGPEILHLARIREATFPFATVAQPVLEELAGLTGETAHCSLYTKDVLAVISSVESKKANRVSMRGSEILPLHATAAGIAFLAFAPEDVIRAAMKLQFTAFTSKTCKSANALQKLTANARKNGFAIVNKAFEEDVYGVAAPIFGSSQFAVGAIAVATPCHRLTKELEQLVTKSVTDSAHELSRRLRGEW